MIYDIARKICFVLVVKLIVKIISDGNTTPTRRYNPTELESNVCSVSRMKVNIVAFIIHYSDYRILEINSEELKDIK